MNKHFFQLPSTTTSPFHSIYPTKFGVEISFPISVSHQGREYYLDEKYAIDKKTGYPCAYYKCGDDDLDRRVWLLCDGTIKED